MSEFSMTIRDICLRLEAEGVPIPSAQWLSKLLSEDQRFVKGEGELYIRSSSAGRPYLFTEKGYQLIKEIRIAGLQTQKPGRVRGADDQQA